MIGIDIYVISLSEVSEKTMVSACLTSFGNNFQTNIFFYQINHQSQERVFE